MAGLFEELEQENAKSGLFTNSVSRISYRLGFPILDENLGVKQIITLPDGTTYSQTQLGIPAGTHTMWVGPSSSGKTTAAIQAAWNIVEPFGDDAGVVHCDKENSYDLSRVQTLTGASNYQLSKQYRYIKDNLTWETILQRIVEIAEKKASEPKRFMYNTKVKDIFGNDIMYYIPTVFIIDSLMNVTSDSEDTETISGLTSGGRETVLRNKFYRNSLEYMGKYNINVFMINHLSEEMQMMGKSNSKKLTFIPTGKSVPGGDRVVLLTSSMIAFQPINSKDQIKNEEENGYNGLPVKALVCKSRSSIGGETAILELVQEAGFDPRLTLLNFAKDKGIIQGRNPNCYFQSNPDVKFDTRKMIEEMRQHPEILKELFASCKPELEKLIAVDDTTDSTDFIKGASSKNEIRQLMNEYLNY